MYDTKMSRFLDHLEERLEEIDKSEYDKYKRLVDQVHEKAMAYLGSRMRFNEQSNYMKGVHVGESDRREMERVDRARRAAHNALVDSITIAARNLYQKTKDMGPMPKEFNDLLGGQTTREQIADAAIAYAYKLLDEDSHLEQYPNAAK